MKKKTYKFITNRKEHTIQAVDYEEALELAEIVIEESINEVITVKPYEVH